jgi:hypothetical protein
VRLWDAAPRPSVRAQAQGVVNHFSRPGRLHCRSRRTAERSPPRASLGRRHRTGDGSPTGRVGNERLLPDGQTVAVIEWKRSLSGGGPPRGCHGSVASPPRAAGREKRRAPRPAGVLLMAGCWRQAAPPDREEEATSPSETSCMGRGDGQTGAVAAAGRDPPAFIVFSPDGDLHILRGSATRRSGTRPQARKCSLTGFTDNQRPLG